MKTVIEEAGEPLDRAGAKAARPSVAAARERVVERVLGFGFAILVGLAVLLVGAGQLAEDLADSPPIQMLPPEVSSHRWAVVAVVLYILLISRIVERTVRRSLPALRGVVRIDDASFRAYQVRMAPASARIHLAILGISAAYTAFLFVLLGWDLPTGDPVTKAKLYLPPGALDSLVILAAYTLVGWAILTLIFTTVRLARALGALSREPFDVDVFDTSNLVPFGNIALAVALAPAGVILITLLGLGLPSGFLGWSLVIEAALASILALLLPLRGIHGQMTRAKLGALATLNTQIGVAFNEATAPSIAPAQLGPLNERTSILIPLRKTVQEMTTWPFRDTVAFGRAVLIASAPLIYAALTQLIDVFWITPLRGP
jgi:hypothetical protein